MKKTYKLAVAVALAVVAGNASASLTLTASDVNGTLPINNGAGSSVLLAVTDLNSGANLNKTFLLDLGLGAPGLTYSSFINGTQGTSHSLNWDLTGYSQFLPLAADAANLKWSVVSGSVLDVVNLSNLDKTDPATYTAVAPWGVAVTTKTPEQWVTGIFTGNDPLVQQAQVGTGTVGGAIYAANASLTLLGATAANNVLAPAAGNGAYNYTENLPYEGTIGTKSTTFYAITNPTGLLGGADVNQVTQLGTFSLAANNVLTYNPLTVTAVPLPTGAWLFLSGLVSLLGLKRNHKYSVSAA